MRKELPLLPDAWRRAPRVAAPRHAGVQKSGFIDDDSLPSHWREPGKRGEERFVPSPRNSQSDPADVTAFPALWFSIIISKNPMFVKRMNCFPFVVIVKKLLIFLGKDDTISARFW